ncbi:hypothetical protein DPMN_087181 [Dreissena polymorpha]|uniref:Uncharacterized protein n=1 Tax=Dreissena polymorpha TaxID=45954 RepID=A0A9D4KSB6_DREPO|nr:hypothetical protein DPMN_087181 [Dreissena polymorpha]
MDNKATFSGKVTPPTTACTGDSAMDENKKAKPSSTKGKALASSSKKDGSPKPSSEIAGPPKTPDETNIDLKLICREMKEFMTILQGAIAKHDGVLESVCGRLSSLEESGNCHGNFDEGELYDDCEDGEVLELASDKTTDTPVVVDKHISERESRFLALSSQFKNQETTCSDIEEELAQMSRLCSEMVSRMKSRQK